MNEVMTPGERRELRTVVRQRMKVLRADVRQREVELRAEAERRLTERYRDQDKAVEDINWRIGQIVDQANKDITALLEKAIADNPDVTLNRIYRLNTPHVTFMREDRAQLHRSLTAGIEAQVKTALLDLDRQEADLLQTLAVGGLETEEARRFLGRIPSVAELVPSSRLREIEAAFDSRA